MVTPRSPQRRINSLLVVFSDSTNPTEEKSREEGQATPILSSLYPPLLAA
jgi:hypothetical protein